MHLILELRNFLPLSERESYYKGYFIPLKPGWARTMISKKRADGLIESVNSVIFTDGSGTKLLWQKEVLKKTQPEDAFDRDLEEFKKMLQDYGILIFIEDYRDAA